MSQRAIERRRPFWRKGALLFACWPPCVLTASCQDQQPSAIGAAHPRGDGADARSSDGASTGRDARVEDGSADAAFRDGAIDAGPVFVADPATDPIVPRVLCRDAGSSDAAAPGADGAPPTDASASCTTSHCPGAVELAIGARCVRMRDGTVRCAAQGSAPESIMQDKGLHGVRSLACGAAHCCALLDGGAVDCWGANTWGTLGDPSVGKRERPDPAPVPGVTNVEFLATRDTFYGVDPTCVIRRDGEVLCWGGSNRDPPHRIESLAGARQLAVVDAGVCGLLDARTVRCNALANAIATFLFPEDIVAIEGAWYQICAVTVTGSLWCAPVPAAANPKRVASISHPALLASGVAETCALLEDGTVACHGPDSMRSELPEYCAGPNVVDLTYGFNALCALYADGRIHCTSTTTMDGG